MGRTCKLHVERLCPSWKSNPGLVPGRTRDQPLKDGISNKLVCWPQFLEYHIYYVNDMLDDKGDFPTYGLLMLKCWDVCPQHCYMQLLSAVTTLWRAMIKIKIKITGSFRTCVALMILQMVGKSFLYVL